MTLRRAPTLNLPNQLTVLRLGMCGLLLISMSFDWPYAATTAFFIFTLASLTDWLDGAIARARNLVTDLGKLLDPLADKILITGALVAPGGAAASRRCGWSCSSSRANFSSPACADRRRTSRKFSPPSGSASTRPSRRSSPFSFRSPTSAWASSACRTACSARFLGAAQMPLYWFALFITVFSGAIYFWKNAAIVQRIHGSRTARRRKVVPAASEITEVPLPEPVVVPVKPSAPAFKEWEAIVEALGHGAQIVILRKGGIAEGRAGFQARHPKFWLFPTGYHQQWEKTKPELRRFVTPVGRAEKGSRAPVFRRGDRRGLSLLVGAGGAAGRRSFLGRGNPARTVRVQGPARHGSGAAPAHRPRLADQSAAQACALAGLRGLQVVDRGAGRLGA